MLGFIFQINLRENSRFQDGWGLNHLSYLTDCE